MSENTKTCPFCGEEILEVAKKCRYCGEWFTDKEKVDKLIMKLKSKKVEEQPLKKTYAIKSKMSWLRILICLTFMFLVVTIGIYEKNAQEVLSYSQKLKNEEKYKTAIMASQVVVEKFWMSFATLDAKENIYKIKSRIGFSPDKRLGMTSAERYIGWFNPYKHHGLPIVVSLTCGVILLFTFLLNLCFLRFMFFKLMLGVVSVGFFITQLIHYGIIKYAPFDRFAHDVMSNSSMVFILCYLLIIISMITILIPRERRE